MNPNLRRAYHGENNEADSSNIADIDRPLLSAVSPYGQQGFNIRLLVGGLFDAIMKNKADHTKKWFRVSEAEMKLYERLKVKKWKGKMPTYDIDAFDTSKHSWDEIVQSMCQSELVHETNVILSFLPVAASVWFGSFWVFLITSLLSAVFDLMFVFMQRFNRSRILRMKARR